MARAEFVTHRGATVNNRRFN